MRTPLNWHHLDYDLLLDTISAVESLDDVVRATVLKDSIPHLDFPFEHADHKASVEQIFPATVRNS